MCIHFLYRYIHGSFMNRILVFLNACHFFEYYMSKQRCWVHHIALKESNVYNLLKKVNLETHELFHAVIYRFKHILIAHIFLHKHQN